MNLVAGNFVWVRGQGVCRYSHATKGLSHVVSPYQPNSDAWELDLYVDPKDILREASEEDREMYRGNVRKALEKKP